MIASITADKSHPPRQPATGRLRPATQINFPRPVIAVLTYLAVRGRCYLVGGVVRDLLMQRSPADFDLATDLPPEQIRLAFPEAVEMDNLTRTFVLHIEGIEIEITPLQNTGSARIEESLMHRDLTINAMALPVFFRGGRLTLGTLLDPTGKGVSDVAAGRIRFNGKIRPENLIRACRFLATLGFEIDGEQKELMAQNSSLIAQSAPEKVQNELKKMLEGENPLPALSLLRESGVLGHMLRFAGAPDSIRTERADFDRVARTEKGLRLIVFLYELGYSAENVATFMGKFHHSTQQTERAQKLLLALETTKARFEEMRQNDQASRKVLAQLVSKRGKGLYFEDYVNLLKVYFPLAESIEMRIKESMRVPLTIKELAITGDDVARRGFSGVEIGAVLKRLLEQVIADPSLNNHDVLLSLLNT